MLLMPPRPAPRNSFDDSGDFSRDNFGFNSSGCASVFIGRLGQAYGLQGVLFKASAGRRGGSSSPVFTSSSLHFAASHVFFPFLLPGGRGCHLGGGSFSSLRGGHPPS